MILLIHGSNTQVGIASPSPNWEQEVKCVAGKNLINAIETNKHIDTSGTILVDDAQFIGISEYVECKPNTTYSITFQHDVPSAQLFVGYKNKSGTFIQRVGYSTGRTFQTPSNAYSLFFYVYVNGGSLTSGGYVQLEESPKPTPYLPYNTIEEVVSGKNLFDKNNITFYASNNTDFNGVDASNKTRERTNSIAITDVGIKTNTTYKVSGLPSGWELLGIGTFTQENGTNTNQGSVNNNAFIINDDNIKYIFYLFRNNSSTEVATELFNNANIQVEQGSTATPYEPYKTPKTYQFSLGDKKLYDECTIVGSPDNWKYVDKLKYIKATSDFTISKSGSTANVLFNVQEPTITNEIETPATNNTVVSDIYCNIAKGGYSANQLYASNIIGISINIYKAIQLGLGVNSEINTVEKLKTYFDNNDVYFIYPLTTPIETPITEETLISQLNAWYNAQSIKGTTIIESNGDLPMIIKVRGLKGE